MEFFTRKMFLAFLFLFVLTVGVAADTDIVLQARAIGSEPGTGTSVIHIDDFGGGPFILDVMIFSDEPMTAFKVTLGGVGSYAAMIDFYGVASYNYADDPGPPPTNSAGWSTAMSDVWHIPAGSLPMIGASEGGVELGSIFGDQGQATSGMACWLEISNYEVGTIFVMQNSAVGDAKGMPIANVGLGKLIITPEPKTISLLTIGIPFMRQSQS